MFSWFPVCMWGETMGKRIRKAICLMLTLLLLVPVWQAPVVVPASDAAVSVDRINHVLAETKAYILDLDREPDRFSQWFALGLGRGGMDLNNAYFQTFYKNMAAYIAKKKGVLTQVKYTEYSKAILALTAVGIDARDVNGYNLLRYLADFSNITRQGFNGPIWALLALNSHPAYTIPVVDGVEQQTTEKVLVDYLLAGEIRDQNGKLGGWSLTGDAADVDITAMTIQALAPYYGKNEYGDVTEAIDRGIETLSAMQVASTGGFASMGANNSESCAQVLVALCAVGIDPQRDDRFIKPGGGIVNNLLSYHVEGSGFMHVKAGETNNGGAEAGTVNGMATEQGFYALTAYKRLLDRKTCLYNMSDTQLKKGETVIPGDDDQQNGGSNGQTGDGNNSGKTEGDGAKTDNDGSGNTTRPSGTGNKGNTSSGTTGKTAGKTKKPTGKTKKPAGTIKTSGAGQASGKTGTSGKTGASGGTNSDGGGKNQDTETSGTSEISETSETSETSGIPESSGMPESAEEGWSFAGEEYVPESSAVSGTEESQEAAPPKQEQPEKTVSYWVMALGVLGGGIAGGGIVWRVGKRKKTG